MEKYLIKIRKMIKLALKTALKKSNDGKFKFKYDVKQDINEVRYGTSSS